MPDSDYEQIFTYSITQRKLSFKVFKTIPYERYATSGKGEFMNDPTKTMEENKGPIPEGDYIIYPNELSDPPRLNDLANYARVWNILDWGDWRVKLHPAEGNTTPRTGLYLHGGFWEGSAGCIDIGGGIFGNEETSFIKDVIMKTRKPILLRVVR